MKTFSGFLMILLLLLAVSCGKKSNEPQTQQGIVPANVLAQIPGTKVGK